MGQPFDQKILEELIEEVDEDKSGKNLICPLKHNIHIL